MKKHILFIAAVIQFICFSTVHASDTVSMDDPKAGNESEITSPVLINYATSGMPIKAVEDRVEGFVTIKFTVTKEGKVENPVVVEAVPSGYFENAALNALEKYEFKPATRYGEPIEYTIEWPFLFKFQDSSFSENVDNRMQACRYADIGKRLIENKAEYSEAVKEISKAIDLEPKFATAYYYRSLAYMNMKEYEKAISDLNRAIELTNEVFGYYTQRGTIYLFKKDYEKAIQDFNKSLTIEPRNILAYINRGDVYRESGELEKAITDYTSALGLNENLIHVIRNRGYTYYKLKNNFQACKDFKKACDLGDCRALEYLQSQGVCVE